MVPAFVIRGGTVAGRRHLQAGRNNQDAFAWRQGEQGLVAAVCDGCSSGAHSELGARLGCELLVQALFEALSSPTCAELVEGAAGEGAGMRAGPLEALEQAQNGVLGALSRLACAMGGAAPGSPSFLHALAEHFLFTVVGAALTEQRAFAFALGDGALAVNGALERLGPFPGNAPPYLSYPLAEAGPVALQLRPLPAPGDLSSIVLATDGAAGLDLTPFVDDPRVLANPDMVRRLLWMQGRHQKLEDDATLVVIRRAP